MKELLRAMGQAIGAGIGCALLAAIATGVLWLTGWAAGIVVLGYRAVVGG